MRINQKGWWENDTDEGHGVDPNLAEGIYKFLLSQDAHSVIDLGCGTGYYTNYLNRRGIECLGIDGNPNTKKLAGEDALVMDLTQHLYLEPSDWVLSLEVGEHIPEAFEQTFLDNIARNAAHGVILSWAIPDQPGDGHVNCRENAYIIEQMWLRNFNVSVDDTIMLREWASAYPRVGWWFNQSLMVFLHKEQL